MHIIISSIVTVINDRVNYVYISIYADLYVRVKEKKEKGGIEEKMRSWNHFKQVNTLYFSVISMLNYCKHYFYLTNRCDPNRYWYSRSEWTWEQW